MSPASRRKETEKRIFSWKEVFFTEECVGRALEGLLLFLSQENRSLGTVWTWWGRGASHTLEPRLLPSREPGAQREGTAYSGHVRDSATGSGRAALCQYPGLQGLVAAGGGGALLQPLGTWLSQMPQPGSVSGTCVRAFYISIKS